MSLYYEAAALLESADAEGGSLKSRVYGRNDLKSAPGAVFALVTEATKWSEILKEVIERSGILGLERKLTPTLALLLVHDLLLSKRGIAAPKQHALSLAATKHKARLAAELTKSRLRRGYATLEAFRTQINAQTTQLSSTTDEDGIPVTRLHPRWIRINTLRTTLDAALSTTFATYTVVKTLAELFQPVVSNDSTYSDKRLVIDPHIPNLVAVPPHHDLSKTPAYRAGQLIFQDKASCFPAYLLDPTPRDGRVIDACAAPGNKTTHLAALLNAGTAGADVGATITACERDVTRAGTLQKMVALAGTDQLVDVRAGQDFLRLDPSSREFADVGALLLDPSCSGSGIVGRDDRGGGAVVHLPALAGSNAATGNGVSGGRKRKRKTSAPAPVEPTPARSTAAVEPRDEVVGGEEEEEQAVDADEEKLAARLSALSNFQLKLLTHAMRFPAARKITYSTCSVHAAENEQVVLRALASEVAKKAGWRMLRRDEQVEGMRVWSVRGDVDASLEFLPGDQKIAREVAEACIRCEKGTEEGTMGFFVAAFVKDMVGEGAGKNNVENGHGVDDTDGDVQDEEWEGFSDG